MVKAEAGSTDLHSGRERAAEASARCAPAACEASARSDSTPSGVDAADVNALLKTSGPCAGAPGRPSSSAALRRGFPPASRRSRVRCAIALAFLFAGALAWAAPAAAQVNITVSFKRGGPYELREGGQLALPIDLNGATATRDLTVDYSVSRVQVAGTVTAVGGRERGSFVLGQVTIPARSDSTVLTLKAPDDSLVRDDNEFTVTLTSVSPDPVQLFQLPFQVTVRPDAKASVVDVTLIDDDELTVTIERTPEDSAFAEGGIRAPGQAFAADQAFFTVHLRGGISTGPVRIPFYIPRNATATRRDVLRPTTTTPGARVEGNTLILPAGASSGLLIYTARNDEANEGQEELIVALGRDAATQGRARAGSPSRASAVLKDNDTTFVTLSPATVAVREGGTASLRIAFSGATLDGEVEVTYRIRGTGITAGDFGDLPGRPDPAVRDPLQRIASIPAAAVRGGSAALSIPISLDFETEEGEETASLSLLRAAPVAREAGALSFGSATTARLTLQPQGGLVVGFSNQPEVTEGEKLIFTLEVTRPGIAQQLNMDSSDFVEGRYEILLGSESRKVLGSESPAAERIDLDLPPGTSLGPTLFTLRGETTMTVTVQTDNDRKVEPYRETLAIELSDLESSFPGVKPTAHPTRGIGIGTILDDDIRFAIAGPAEDVFEGGKAVFIVSREEGSLAATTVGYEVSGLAEGEFSHPEDPPVPSEPLRGRIAIGEGAANAELVLAIEQNLDVEATRTRTLTVTLEEPAQSPRGPNSVNSLEPGRSRATATIVNDDLRVAFAESGPLRVAEGGILRLPLVFTGGVATQSAPLRLAVSGEAERSDFSAGHGFQAGDDGVLRERPNTLGQFIVSEIRLSEESQSRVEYLLQTRQDNLLEGDETFTVRLEIAPTVHGRPRTIPSAVQQIAGEPLTVTIEDDDAVTLSFAPPPRVRVTEGGGITFPLTASGASVATDVLLPFRIDPVGGAGLTAGDFAAGPAARRTPRSSLIGAMTLRRADFEPGGALNLTLFTRDDAESEPPEHFTVVLTPGGPVRVLPSAGRSDRATIDDNDALTVGLGALATATQVEGGAAFAFPLRFRGQLPAASSDQVGVTYRIFGSGIVPGDFARPDADGMRQPLTSISGLRALYTAAQIRAAGEPDASPLVVPAFFAHDDAESETDEVFTVRLTAATGAGLEAGRREATGTITDNDAGEGIGLRVAPLAGQTVVEGKEFGFRVIASRAPGAAIVGLFQVKVGTDPGAATLGGDGSEDGDGDEDVDRNRKQSDFSGATTGSFTLPAGETRSTEDLKIGILDDGVVEPEMEVFTVKLVLEPDTGGPEDEVSVSPPAKVYIQENDVGLSIAGRAATRPEGAAATFTVTRTGATTPAVTVTYAVSGTGVDTGDFDHPAGATDPDNPLRGRVAIPGGATRAAFALALTDDSAFEGNETLVVTLQPAVTGVSGSVVLEADAESDAPAGSASVSVVDDDVRVAFGALPAKVRTVKEGESATFPIELEGPVPTESLAVFYSLSGTSITAGDFEADAAGQRRLTGRVARFSPAAIRAAGQPGAPPLLLAVQARNDGVVEAAEPFTVTLVPTPTPSAGAEVSVTAARASAPATITVDPSDRVTVSISGTGDRTLAVTEGEGDITFPLTFTPVTFSILDGRVEDTIELTYDLAAVGGSSLTAGDFKADAAKVSRLTRRVARFTPDDIEGGRGGPGVGVPFTLATRDDTESELTERFTITLVAAGVVSAVPPSVPAEIRDNDGFVVGIGPPSPATREEGGAAFAFPLSFAGSAPTEAVTVSYALSGAGITADDFETAGSNMARIALPGLTGLQATYSPEQIRGSQAPGASSLTLPSLFAADDAESEGAEPFAVTLTGTTAGNLATRRPRAQATIEDNDFGVSIERTPEDDAFREDGEGADRQASFDLRIRGGAPPADVRVPFTVTGVSARDLHRTFAVLAPSDRDTTGRLTRVTDPRGAVTGLGGTVTLPRGTTAATLVLTARPDDAVEGDEVLRVELGPPTTTSGTVVLVTDEAQRRATAVLADSQVGQDPPTVSIAGPAAGDAFREGGAGPDAEAVFTITVEGDVAADGVEIPYALRGEGISAGDFRLNGNPIQRLTGTLTFSLNHPTARLVLTAEDDSEVEGDETVTVELTQPVRATNRPRAGPAPTLPPVSATATVADNDVLTVSIARTEGDGDFQEGGTQEGGEGTAAQVSFTIQLEGGTPTAEVVVPFRVTGVSSADVTASSGRLTRIRAPGPLRLRGELAVPARAISAALVFTALDDDLVEGDEKGEKRLTVLLGTEPTTERGRVLRAASRKRAVAQATLKDDDALEVGIGAPSPDTRVEGGEAFAFPLSWKGGVPTGDVTVTYELSGEGEAGEKEAGAEEARRGITADDFATAGSGGARNPLRSLTDGLQATFTPAEIAAARRQGAPPLVLPEFFAAVDTKEEDAETFTVTLTSVKTAGRADTGRTTAKGTIASVRGIAVRIVPVGAATVTEGQPFRFRIAAGAPAPLAIRGQFRTALGATDTAGAGDFSAVAGAGFGIPAGKSQTAETFSIATADDREVEADRETFTIELSDVRLGSDPRDIAVTPFTVEIQENDLRLSVTAPAAAVVEGAAATFTVRRQGATPPAVTVSYAVSGTAGTGDFRHPPGASPPNRPRSGTLRLAAGAASTALAFALTDDGVVEGDETLVVTLRRQVLGVGVGGAVELAASADPEGAPGSASVTIADDDLEVGFVAPAVPPRVAEGQRVALPLTLRGAVPAANLTLRYSLSGTWITADDFGADAAGSRTLSGRVVTFTPDEIRSAREEGAAPLTVSVSPERDGRAEGREVFTATLAARLTPGAGPELAVDPARATARAEIEDNDPLTVGIGAPSPDTRVEGGPAFAFPLTFGGTPPAGSVTVTYALSAIEGAGIEAGDFASAGADGARTPLRELTGRMETFTSAQIRGGASLRVFAADDTASEGPETFTVTLTAVTEGSFAAGRTTATGTIADNDTLRVSIVGPEPGNKFGEGATDPDDRAVFTIRLAGGTPTAAVEVPYTLTGIQAGDVTVSPSPPRPDPGAAPDPRTGRVTLAAGTTSTRLVLIAKNDMEPETDETVTVTLGTPTTSRGAVALAAAASMHRASATLTDDGDTRPGTLTVALAGPAPDDVFREGGRGADGQATFTVTLIGGAPSAEVRVPFELDGAGDLQLPVTTATRDARIDTSAALPVLVIPAGQTTANLLLTARDDSIREGDETVTVTLGTPTTADGQVELGSARSARVTLVDDDLEVTIEFARDNDSLFREGGVGRAAQVRFTVRVAGGTPTAAVRIPFRLADSLPDIPLADRHDIQLPPRTPTAGARVVRPNRGRTPPDPATALGVLILPAGRTSADLLFTAVDDRRNEGEESLQVTLLAPISADPVFRYRLAAPATAGAPLEDNDVAVVSIAVPRPEDRVRAEGGSFPLRLRFAGPISQPNEALTEIFVTYKISGMGITAADFATLPGTRVEGSNRLHRTITFPRAAFRDLASRRELEIDLRTAADTEPEDREEFDFRLVDIATGPVTTRKFQLATGEAAVAQLAIRPIAVSIARTAGDSAFLEGRTGAAGQASFTVSLGGDTSPVPIRVPFKLEGAADRLLPATTPVIPAGVGEAVLLLTAKDDDMAQRIQTVTVVLQEPTAVRGDVRLGSPSRASADLIDDDSVVLDVFPTNPERYQFREGRTGDAAQASFTFRLVGGRILATDRTPVKIRFDIDGSSATRGDDYDGPTIASQGARLDDDPDDDPEDDRKVLQFPAGQREARLVFTAKPDSRNEGDETVTVTPEERYLIGTTQHDQLSARSSRASATLIDAADDHLVVSIARTPGDSEFREGGALAAREASFTVTLSGGTSSTGVRVPFFVAADSTVIAADFVGPTTPTSRARIDGSTLILPAGATSALLVYTAFDDLLNEGNEQLNIALGANPTTAGSIRTGSNASASAELEDNDSAFVSVGPATAMVREGESASLRLAFGGRLPAQDFEITYRISGAGITAADFGTLPGRPDPDPEPENPLQRIVTVPAAAVRSRSSALAIPVALDSAHEEGTETATVAIVAARTAVPGAGAVAPGTPAAAQLTIGRNAVTFVGVSTAQAVEGKPLVFTISANRPFIGRTLGGPRSNHFIQGRYRVVLGTGRGAADEEDFAPGTSFAPTPFTIRGQTNTTVSVGTANDSLVGEGPETFTVVLSDLQTSISALNPRSDIAAHPTRGIGIGTILDDDNGLAIEGPSAPVSEDGVAVFTISRKGSSGAMSFPYTVSGVGAGDFRHPREAADPGNPLRGRLAIGEGASSAELALEIVDNAEVEATPTRTLTVTLQAPAPAPGEGVTALAADDASATATLVNNDLTAAFAESAPLSVTEGGTLRIPITFAGGVATADARLRLVVSGGVEAADFSAAHGFTLEAGSLRSGIETVTRTQIQLAMESRRRLTLSLRTRQDTRIEGDETFTLRLEAATGDNAARSIVGKPLTVTIGDDDAVTLRFGQLPVARVTEGGGITFPLTASGTATVASDVVVPFRIEGGSELTAGDFAAGPAARRTPRSSLIGAMTLRPADFEPGGALGLTLFTRDDAESEPPEHFTVVLTPAVGAPVRVLASADRSDPATIEDNDAFTVGLGAPDAPAQVEGGDAFEFPLRFRGQLPAASSDPVGVTYRIFGSGIVPGDFARPDADGMRQPLTSISGLRALYTAAQIRAAGERGASPLVVPEFFAHDDPDSETDEVFTVRLTGATGAGLEAGRREATGTITDNDDEGIGLRVAPLAGQTVVEGEKFRFRVIASRAAGEGAAIRGGYQVEVGNGAAAARRGDTTATLGGEQSDFSRATGATTGSFTVLAGETRTAETFSIETRDDGAVEADMETFTVKLVLDAGGPGVSVSPPVKVYIQENDLRLSIAGPATELPEGAAATFTVTRKGATTPAVTVTYAVSGTGVDAGDFGHPPGAADPGDPLRGRVAIPGGDTSADFALTLTDDGAFEGNETLVVTLQPAVTGGER